MKTVILSGLEGVSAQEVQAEWFRRSDKVEGILKRSIAATTANDNGAINIWRDDSGDTHGEVQRHLMTIETITFKDISEVQPWAKKWLKEIK